jgi:threonine/homoserine/homoserine lactone efflux protein
MEKKVSPVDLLRLWIVGIAVLATAFLLAFCLISCSDAQAARLRKGLTRVTDSVAYICRLDSVEHLNKP